MPDTVINIDRKKELDILHKNITVKKDEDLTIIQKYKDWSIKGFQINRCYDDDWDFITDTFEKYDLNLNEHGPIITINEKRHVEFVEKLIEEIKKNKGISLQKRYELASIGYNNLFILFLRIYPEFCRQRASEEFRKWLFNNKSSKHLAELCDIHGTIKETDKQFENIVSCIVNDLK